MDEAFASEQGMIHFNWDLTRYYSQSLEVKPAQVGRDFTGKLCPKHVFR